MPVQHNIKIAGETYTNIDSLQMNGANSEEGKTIEYICPEWDNLSFDDTTPILGTHTTDKDGFKTVTIESDDLNAANIIESATIFGVEGAIPINEDADITVHGNRLTVPAGYYPNMTARTVDNGTLTLTKNFDAEKGKFTTAANVTKNGYLTSAANTSAEIQLDTANANTIYPSTSEQIAVPANRYTLGEIKVAAMEYASGSLGGDAYNGKATPDIRYDSVEGIKTTKPSGSDFITIGASVRTEPAGYAPRYNVLQAGYIGTSLYADKEDIPVTAEEDKVIYIETDNGTTVTPSTEEQTIALTGKFMKGDVVVEAMPEGELGSLVLEEKDGTVNASLAIRTPGYVDELDYRTNTLELSKATLSWTVGTVPGGCEAKITNQDNIRTVNANHDGDYYTIKATAIGNDGEAGLDVTEFTAGYLSTNPIEGSSYVGVSVASDEVGKEIHIPKATLSTSGATVSVTEAGYLPEGEFQTVQSGAYKANATATADLSIGANKGNIEVSQQSSEEAASSGYYFKVSGTAYARADASAEVTTAGYIQTGSKPAFDENDTSTTTYYTVATSKKGVTPTKGYQTITPEENTLLSEVIVDPIPDTYAEITGYNYDITSAGQHNIRNYNYATVAEGKVEINDDTIEFNAIVNEDVQTGDYGRPYYKIEVQQGSENTSVSATVTQSGYVTAGEEVDSTPLTVNVSGAVFQSQIADPGPATDTDADATIGYQQEIQIGAGYYPYPRVVKNGVEPTTRAQTTIGVSAYDASDKMTVSAANNQTTGYVIANPATDKTSVDIQLTQGTPSINSSTGVISATATMTSGAKSVSQSKTLSLNTKGATTITPDIIEQTAVEAGVYTTGKIKVAAMPTVDRASTTIGAAATSLNKMTITASNDQATGYVEGSDEDASLEVELTANGPTVTATATDGTKVRKSVNQVSRASTTLQADVTDTNEITITAENNQSAGYSAGGNQTATTTITQNVDGPTVTATVGDKSISATIPNGALKTPYSTVYDSGLIITSYGVDTAGYLDASNKTSTKQLTTVKQYEYVPTTYDQSIVKGQWIDSAITIKGDPNLQPYNIKKDVTIFGVTGEYQGEVSAYTLSGRWRLNGNLITDAVFANNSETIGASDLVFGVYSEDNQQLMQSVVGMEFNGTASGAVLYYGNTPAYSTGPDGFAGLYHGWQGQYWVQAPTTIDILGVYTVNEKFYNWFTSVATRIDNSEFNTCILRINGMPYFGYGFDGISTYSLAGEGDNTIMCGAPLLLQEGMGNEVPELLSVYNYTLGYTVNLQRIAFYPRAEGQPLSVYTIPMEYKNMTLELMC